MYKFMYKFESNSKSLLAFLFNYLTWVEYRYQSFSTLFNATYKKMTYLVCSPGGPKENQKSKSLTKGYPLKKL